MVDNTLDHLSKLKSRDIVERRKELQNQIPLIERKVERFLDRIAAANSAILITSYER